MKKIAGLTFILVSCALFQVNAQEFGFGLKGGLNLAKLQVDDPEASYESRTGYHAGIFLRGKFHKIGIQPEILFSTQGSKVTTDIDSYKESFTYLNIPVILKFYMFKGLNIHAGPQFGFLLDAESEYNPLGLGNIDIKNDYKKSDISASLGAGYDFGFGLNADVRYNIGLKDINDKVDGEEVKNQVFMISLGWNFLRHY